MKPVPEWRRVLKHAWSVRFMAASVVLSAAGGAMMLINPEMTGHPYAWAAGAFFMTAAGGIGALVSRVVKQKNVP